MQVNGCLLLDGEGLRKIHPCQLHCNFNDGVWPQRRIISAAEIREAPHHRASYYHSPQ